MRGAHRVPDRPPAVAITVAPNGGTVIFAITVTIRTSDVPVTVHNVGSVTPGPGTACTGRAADLRRRGHLHGHPRDRPAHHHQVPHPGQPDAAGSGEPLTYTVVVTNTSPFTTAHATFNDPVPAMIVADGGWTAVPHGRVHGHARQRGTRASPPASPWSSPPSAR